MYDNQQLHTKLTEELTENSLEYIAWRRLHSSKTRLRNIARMSGILAKFAVIAAVELHIPKDYAVDPTIVLIFVVTWSLQISLGMISLCISSTVLPHIHSFIKSERIEDVGTSLHEKMTRLIDISSVLGVSLCIFLFVINLVLMCVIQYDYFSRAASISVVIIMTPVLVFSVLFGFVFYRRVVNQQYKTRVVKLRNLEEMKEQLDRQCGKIQINCGAEGIIRHNSDSVLSRRQSLPQSRSSAKLGGNEAWNKV